MTNLTSRSLLLLSLLGFSAPVAHADPSPLDADVTTWAPESQAACGVMLVKFGLLVSVKNKTAKVFQILFRGYALNALSEMTAPDLNAAAWQAELNLRDDRTSPILSQCTELFNANAKAGNIPQSVLEDAERKAEATLTQ